MSRDAMITASVRDLLGAFDRLTGPDQLEFLAEILRRTREMEWPPLDDEALAQIADETFLEYDAREADQANQVDPPDRTEQPLNEISGHE
jgi:hypothetical protein